MNDKKLGERIRAFRELQDLSREEMAERTGLSLEFLTSLEEDDITPSLGPLLKVSRALGVRLGTFMDGEAGSDCCLVRCTDLGGGDEVVLHTGAAKKGEGLTFHSLGAGKSDRHMEPFFIEMQPGAEGCDTSLSSHEGEEFIVVVSGQVEVVMARETHVLSPGDSIYFNSIVPHHVGCAGTEPAQIYAVLYFPE
ncbi:cupin domain-containing protein [Desulfovibrio sulfodismutans]|uniref:Cupin domain-containing protein n=1 Tax=Desulfolutivibrio sulfodismutans TaxID=63561 RepID=A0A7K3NI93_9BACT|nr:XRE family transcriptional regulator [Desulfolutivibrio sulfodismutans]NDY55924.1 cupin domain-containing protein [Desulfolutivibrio sulfodismutans]QLA11187.1 cupin domain-containing protein [Desulfolutivibrio sulfodismutans DSM 3696]